VDTDCLSQDCDATGHCAPSCIDGIDDGTETDVDCGGPTCSPCGVGQHCAANADCATQNCVYGGPEGPSSAHCFP